MARSVYHVTEALLIVIETFKFDQLRKDGLVSDLTNFQNNLIYRAPPEEWLHSLYWGELIDILRIHAELPDELIQKMQKIVNASLDYKVFLPEQAPKGKPLANKDGALIVEAQF